MSLEAGIWNAEHDLVSEPVSLVGCSEAETDAVLESLEAQAGWLDEQLPATAPHEVRIRLGDS